jgi:hypothetical protein
LNSTALCQGWNAKVVRHIIQKSVAKNAPSNCSSIRLRPSIDSGSTARRSIVRMCFSLKPNAGATTRRSSIMRRDLDEVFMVSFQASVSSVTVRPPSSVGIESNSANVQA